MLNLITLVGKSANADDDRMSVRTDLFEYRPHRISDFAVSVLENSEIRIFDILFSVDDAQAPVLEEKKAKCTQEYK